MQLDKQKLIFLHPGKTGGSSIEAALVQEYAGATWANFVKSHKYGDYNLMFGLDTIRNIYLQHACLRLYEIFEVPLRKFTTYLTVRRPYERVLSAYYYNGYSSGFKACTFEEFVLNKLEGLYKANFYEKGNSIVDYPKYHINHFAPCTLYYKRGRYKVNNILKCENLAKDAKTILGLTLPKQKHAQTVASKHHKKHLDAYNQKMKDTVYALYLEDFKTFGYRR